MKLTRRGFAGVAVGGVAALAGCGQVASFSSEPARIPMESRRDAGYEETNTETIEESREVGGQEVTVSNHLAQYQKELEFGPLGSVRLGAFAALTTPSVSLAGEEYNPIGDLSDEELAREVQGRYDGLNGVERVGAVEATVFGERRDVSQFEATAPVQGERVELELLLTRVRHDYTGGEDFVVAFAGYPALLADGEREDARTMFGGLEHPAETDGES